MISHYLIQLLYHKLYICIKYWEIFNFYLQLSETAEDDGGVTSRLGQAHRAGGDLSVDRLMHEAICVVGKSLGGNENDDADIRCPRLVD